MNEPRLARLIQMLWKCCEDPEPVCIAGADGRVLVVMCKCGARH